MESYKGVNEMTNVTLNRCLLNRVRASDSTFTVGGVAQETTTESVLNLSMFVQRQLAQPESAGQMVTSKLLTFDSVNRAKVLTLAVTMCCFRV